MMKNRDTKKKTLLPPEKINTFLAGILLSVLIFPGAAVIYADSQSAASVTSSSAEDSKAGTIYDYIECELLG